MKKLLKISFILILAAVLTVFALAASEIEPNDDIVTATRMQLNQPYTGKLQERYGEDWYSFTLTKPGIVSVKMATVKQENDRKYWDITVRDKDDPSYTLWSTSISGYNTVTESSKLGLVPGTYYIYIDYSSYWSESEYTITVNYEEANNWEKELNEKWTTATPVEFGKTYYGSLRNSYSYENDWYSFTVTAPGVVTVKLDTEKQENDSRYWSFSLRDKDNIDYELWKRQINGYTTSTSSPEIGLGPGTYYICVRSDSYWASAPYGLTVSYSAADNWETELNEKWTTAVPIEVNQTYYGSLRNTYSYEKDWYSFTVTVPSSVALSFNAPRGEDDYKYWDVSIRDKDNPDKEIWQQHVTGYSTSVTSEYCDVAPGTYFVLVESSNEWSPSTYSISISERHDCKGSWEIVLEPDCINKGTRQQICSTCGEVIASEEINALGHSVENWKTVREVTCTEDGYREGTCARCGEYAGETLAALTHSYSDYVVIKGSKLIPPMVKQRACVHCGLEEIVNDWSYAWISAVIVVAIIIGCINYFKAYRGKK